MNRRFADDAPVLDLYCGGGGLSLGARLAGFTTIIGVDNDLDLSSSFTTNLGKSRFIRADLAKLAPRDLRSEIGEKKLSLVIGGPPCQGFSAIGLGREGDERNKLLRVFFEFVRFYKPKAFVMENVPNLTHRRFNSCLEQALSVIPGRYSLVEPFVANAVDYGVPTNRPRLLIVGFDSEFVDQMEKADFIKAKLSGKTSVHAAIADLPRVLTNGASPDVRRYPNYGEPSEYARSLRQSPPPGCGSKVSRDYLRSRLVSGCQNTVHSQNVVERFADTLQGGREPVSKFHRLCWDEPSNVLRAGTGCDRGAFQAARPIHPSQHRVITVREAARIQGFPDWFQFHGAKWHSHRIIGNSVSPPFAERILAIVGKRMSSLEQGGARLPE